MPRKPFELLVGCTVRSAYEQLSPGHRVVDAAGANAAIAADKAHHVYLLDIGELRIEAVIKERDHFQNENTALREEVAAQQREIERLKADIEDRKDAYTELDDANILLNESFAEAVKVIEAIDHELGRPREVPDANWPAPIVNASDLAREFLSGLAAGLDKSPPKG